MDDWVAISEIVRNIGIVVGGAIGVYLAWKRVTAANRQAEAQTRQAEAQTRQAELQRRDFVAELFNRAVGQLKDEKLEVRLGAIYTLRQIATDFPDLTGAVFDLLNVHLRKSGVHYGDEEPPEDVQEIMKLLRSQRRIAP